MSFGDQTVTFVAVTDGAKDRLGVPALVRTEVDVAGCHFRPLNVSEAIALTDLATERWICTAPPNATVLAAKAIDELKVNGVTYQVTGVKPFNDLSNAVFKVTVICQRQVG